MRVRFTGFLCVVGCVAAIAGAAAASWQQEVDAVFGWQGQDMPGGVHRYTLTPDKTITVDGVTVRPNMVLDGYAAFKQEGGTWLAAAEIATPDTAADAVATTLDAGGLHVTALHNHVLNESPRVKFVHADGTGNPVQMARVIKAAIAKTGWPLRTDEDQQDADDTAPGLNQSQLDAIMKATGNPVDGVLEYTFDHPGSFTLEGLDFPPAMGPESEVHFQSIGGGKAAAVGEFCVTAREALAAVHVLRSQGMQTEIQALHNHWLTDSPRLFFVHAWGTGSASTLAHDMRAVLDAIGQ